MAQVPYQPFQTERPYMGEERINVNVSGNMFGVNIGDALRRLGVTGEEVGDKLFKEASENKRQDNEFAARQQLSAMQQTIALKQAEFDALPGDQQKAQLLGHTQWLNDTRANMLAQLPNRESQLMFDRESQPFVGRTIFTSAARAGESYKKWKASEDEAALSISASTITDGSEAGFIEGVKSQNERVDKSADNNDWGPERREFMKKKLTDMRALGTVKKLLDDGDEEGAQAFIQRHNADFFEATRNDAIARVDQAVVNKVGLKEGTFLAQQNLPDKVLTEKAHDIGQATFPHNPTRALELENSIKHHAFGEDYVQHHREQLQRWKAQQNLSEFITTYYDQTGKAPNGAQISSIRPDIYNALSKTDQAKLPLTIHGIVRAHDMDTQKEEMDRLVTMSRNEKQRFMDVDIWDPHLHLSMPDRKQLNQQRDRIIREGTYRDEYLHHFTNVMRHNFKNALDELHVYDAPPKGVDRPDWNEYQAEMQVGLQTWMDKNQRKPTDKEFLDEIAPHLVPNRLPSSWENFTKNWPIIGGGDKMQHFQLMRAEDQKKYEQGKKELDAEFAAHDREPATPREVFDYLRREQWYRIQEKITKGAISGRGSPDGGGGGPATPAGAVPSSK